MANSFLLVPVQLDALRLKNERTVVEAMADFSELPYNDGTRDQNPNTPFISEAILSPPFENENLVLSPGIHLHWALPDALTVQDDGEFPAVPNRWLIVRKYVKDNTTQTDQWVVESDYLHPDGSGASGYGSSVPVNADPAAGKPRPFRYMGRVTPAALWTESAANSADEFATPLTAAGYGEPAFAAFYPNCASVFGFYDGEFTSEDLAALKLQYYAIGWYSDAVLDPVRSRTAELTDAAALRAAIEEDFEWTFDEAAAPIGPLDCVCFGKLSFMADDDTLHVDTTDLSLSIGSTATEALAAHLARTIVETNVEGIYLESDRAMLEQQLEALALEDSVLQRTVDTGAGFRQVRHEKEFSAVDAGSLWDIKAVTNPSANASAATAAAAVRLPDDIITQLNQLNDVQAQYNLAHDELEGRRRLLFADWYKYMLCAYPTADRAEDYPDIDEVRRFILECDVQPITQLQHQAGRIEVTTADDGDDSIVGVLAAEGNSESVLAVRIAALASGLLDDIAALNAATFAADSAAPTWQLRQIPAPRYWQPNEPVVLLTGKAVKPSERYGKDSDGVAGEYHECEVVIDEFESAAALVQSIELTDRIDGYTSSTGLRTWEQQPWNPILLEWSAEFFPLLNGSSVASGSSAYSTSCVLDNYALEINEPDFTAAVEPVVMSGASIHQGTSILTDTASTTLQNHITEYCIAQIGAEYEAYQAESGTTITVDKDYFASQANVTAIREWYAGAYGATAADPVYTSLRALELLVAADFYSQSQALSGFNDALNMQKQTLQLAISDPLGFAPFQDFAELIADVVGDSIDRAPQPLLDFNPLRAGCLELLDLRLVDSFGQYLDLEWDRVTCATKLVCSWDSGKVYLPPRIAEPARLDFCWISATDEIEQRTPLPPASPVCGWLLTNHLENSIMVYDAAGSALGSIIPDATENYWEPAPGSLAPVVDPEHIDNRHLRNVVQEVIHRAGNADDYLRNFITALDTACNSIEPESASQNQGMSLLVGRPVAVVRAAISLETQGLPEYDQSWTQFRLDLVTGTRETHGFENIVFPVRIGEDEQLNDGLVGYWIEGADGTITDTLYYSLQSDNLREPMIITRGDLDVVDTSDEDLLNLKLGFNGATTCLTMLLDPRGVIHASCGALPAKTITMPPEHYSDVLKKLEVTFLTAPILTGRNQVSLPLSDEPGYSWSWLSLETGAWSEVSTAGVLERRALTAEYPESMWQDLLDAQWLILLADPTDAIDAKALIAARDQRRQDTTLNSTYSADTLTSVGGFLDRHVIGQAATGPSFTERQILREGWLKLAPQPAAATTEKEQ